jgi:hypothetical protein
MVSRVPDVIKSSWPKFEKFKVIRGRVLEKSLFANKEAKEKRIKEKVKCPSKEVHARAVGAHKLSLGLIIHA